MAEQLNDMDTIKALSAKDWEAAKVWIESMNETEIASIAFVLTHDEIFSGFIKSAECYSSSLDVVRRLAMLSLRELIIRHVGELIITSYEDAKRKEASDVNPSS